MTEATAASSPRTELRVDLTAGRRSVTRPLGRLTVDDQELTVRSAATVWIPPRSVSKDAVGEISVVRRIEIKLPVLHWRRVEVVSFEQNSPLADVTIKLSPRQRIVDMLRAQGYRVIDDRT
jgi:hypothetical protein